MNIETSIASPKWHIPRPSLSGSSNVGSISDGRSRGGSASSQGSSSNHSTHSVSSGSLLLSAAHLVRIDTSQGNHTNHKNKSRTERMLTSANTVVSIPEEPRQSVDAFWNDVKRGSTLREDSKDTHSVASSTHFTVVNGFTKHTTSKEPKTCCCKYSHQISVLVISMTILFSACILAAICYVEMRMRKETGIYKYS